MIIIPVTDPDLPELSPYRTLRDNASTEDGRFIADGEKVVVLLLREGAETITLLATQEFLQTHRALIEESGVKVCYVADKQTMSAVVGHKVYLSAMMEGRRPPLCALEQLGERVVVTDLISRNENLGAIVRSMAALGVLSLVAPRRGPHPFGRRALRVSMGYAAMVRTHLYEDLCATLRALKSLGYRLIAAEAAPEATPLQKLELPQGRWALVLGNEECGLDAEVLSLCDETVMIEMFDGVKSLSVSMAASIILYQLTCKG
ncbi:MAG: RNA methyltransferase [Campylobacterales bacterium]|nr:RNA methyltransferase [Campylobacterales bacterium]